MGRLRLYVSKHHKHHTNQRKLKEIWSHQSLEL